MSEDPELAANIIRNKIDGMYKSEPSARLEIRESKTSENRSKHQKFMFDLTNSGKSLAEIQTAWHAYYQALPNDQKHDVWNEFYREYDKERVPNSSPRVIEAKMEPTNPIFDQQSPKIVQIPDATVSPKHQNRSVAAVKKQLIRYKTTNSKISTKDHLKSLGFGLVCGFIALVIFLFGFFNERFIAPFISPSKDVSNAPLIIDGQTAAAGSEPIITIPKINVQIPVIYTEPSVEENAVQAALENGVLHYANTAKPGEKGNGVIFGHSSNNIFNKGKYKFAFVLLKQLEAGDTLTLQKDGKRYVYKVYDKKVVSPNDLSVLSSQPGKIATVTLITCDPPGTTVNRMVVFAEQITPDPNTNVASTATLNNLPVILPSNAPTLWNRFYDWVTSW